MRTIKFNYMLIYLCRNSGPSYLCSRSSSDWQKWHSIEYGWGNFNWKWGRTCSTSWETRATRFLLLCFCMSMIANMDILIERCSLYLSTAWLIKSQFYLGGMQASLGQPWSTFI
jgi:hypothetical protein